MAIASLPLMVERRTTGSRVIVMRREDLGEWFECVERGIGEKWECGMLGETIPRGGGDYILARPNALEVQGSNKVLVSV